jgi:putative transposase
MACVEHIHCQATFGPYIFRSAESRQVRAGAHIPKAHWLQIHSTNPLERLNAEIKRRTNVVGIFPNDRAVTRLVGAMLLEQSDEWTLQRRYMQLEGLQTLSDTAPACLPAVQR